MPAPVCPPRNWTNTVINYCNIGRKLHESPEEIPCFRDRLNTSRFRKNSVIAVETFISTGGKYAYETADGWTMKAEGGVMASETR